MKKWILAILVLFFSVLCFASQVQYSQTITSATQYTTAFTTGAVHHTVGIVAAGIPTTGNVTFQIEGKIDSDWYNMDDLNTVTTLTTTGNTVYIFEKDIKAIRLNFVSKSGGSPTLKFSYIGRM